MAKYKLYILYLALGMVVLISCSRPSDPANIYTCASPYCRYMNLNLSLIDSSGRDVSTYAQGTRYEIYMKRQASGLFSDTYYELITKGSFDERMVLDTSIFVDSAVLDSSAYLISIRIYPPSSVVSCINPFHYSILSYQSGGNIIDSIFVSQSISRNFSWVRTSTDSLTKVECLVSSLCLGEWVTLPSLALGDTFSQRFAMVLGSEALVRVRKHLAGGTYVDEDDTFTVDLTTPDMYYEY